LHGGLLSVPESPRGGGGGNAHGGSISQNLSEVHLQKLEFDWSDGNTNHAALAKFTYCSAVA
jgi:hypothetical protein